MARKAKSASTTIAPKVILRCLCCGKEYDSEIFYGSNSIQFKSLGKLPYCQDCLGEIYEGYKKEFMNNGYQNPEKKAVQRFCMAFDLYYTDKMYDSAVRTYKEKCDKSKKELNFIAFIFQQLKLVQYKDRNYTNVIHNQYSEYKDSVNLSMLNFGKEDDDSLEKRNVIIKKASKFFGAGFEDDDYLFLQEQYEDWTTRHECQTKSQEEMFKQICFTQLSIWKAERARLDTKDLQATFLKQLEAAKLQPKQNKGDTISEAQTFGTLIDKWENTRPIPEPEDDLKDVDKIGLLLDVFFRGHLAKFMGLKNGLSNLYEKYMKKYTVERPEYENEEDTENLFDTIFGSQANMED